MSDLTAEFVDALRATTARHRAALRRLGVPRRFVEVAPAAAVLRARVEGALYTPDADGTPHYVTPVRADRVAAPWEHEHVDPELVLDFGPIVDLVAWRPSAPERWTLRVGTACWLGVTRFRLDPPPIPVWRSPLAWLRGGGIGLVPLARDARELQDLLLRLPALIAEDAAHGRALHALLSRPARVPPIYVAQPRSAVA